MQRTNPGSVMTTVEVKTKNSNFTVEGNFVKNLSNPEGAKMANEDLYRKFRLSTSGPDLKIRLTRGSPA